MKIEAMGGYPGSLKVTRPPTDANMVQLQGKILALTKNIQELTIPRTRRPQVWCTRCYIEELLENNPNLH
jgi:hypothetical protein